MLISAIDELVLEIFGIKIGSRFFKWPSYNIVLEAFKGDVYTINKNKRVTWQNSIISKDLNCLKFLEIQTFSMGKTF